MGFQYYAADKHVITVGSNEIKGFSRDSLIKISPVEESAGAVQGIGGDAIFWSADCVLFDVEMTLLYGSKSNDYLSALYVANQRVKGSGVVPLTINDKNGTTKYIATGAMVLGLPENEVGKEPKDRVWKFKAFIAPGAAFVGGL